MRNRYRKGKSDYILLIKLMAINSSQYPKEQLEHSLSHYFKQNLDQVRRARANPSAASKKILLIGLPFVEVELLKTYKKPLKIITTDNIELYDREFPQIRIAKLQEKIRCKFTKDNSETVWLNEANFEKYAATYLIDSRNYNKNDTDIVLSGSWDVQNQAQKIGAEFRFLTNSFHTFYSTQFIFKQREKLIKTLTFHYDLFKDKSINKLCDLLAYCTSLTNLTFTNILQKIEFYSSVNNLSELKTNQINIYLKFHDKKSITSMVRRTKCEYFFSNIVKNCERYRNLYPSEALMYFKTYKFLFILDFLEGG